ncbi:BsuPI-related putative proteinase inhibitor [Natrononativus amylolyticus]|uniref:BsuPI-related putative proteinase inhibitor n=1 Tax=Natrononativus amylolyticus TaxID=2963434 RepID=UPI0020CD49F1|nr:BsuPI-related putative proteinase inhibitor [Natrononativus amylolyticus]
MTLEGSLDATATDGQVRFAFTVTNTGDEPVELQFSDSCKAEFVLEDEGREVWRFTDGRMFAQVISSETVGPGEEARYEGSWDDPQEGTYTAVAELRAQNRTCEARTDVTA